MVGGRVGEKDHRSFVPQYCLSVNMSVRAYYNRNGVPFQNESFPNPGWWIVSSILGHFDFLLRP